MVQFKQLNDVKENVVMLSTMVVHHGWRYQTKFDK